MNNERRKRIRDEVINRLDMAYNILDEIREEEEEYSSSIPESMEEKKTGAEEMVCLMEDKRDEIEGIKNELAEMIGDDG